jgi:hypothetical protein
VFAGERDDLGIRSLDAHFAQVRLVTAAMRRIGDGSYGYCVQCEEEIGPTRLTALPQAHFCIRCQEEISGALHTAFLTALLLGGDTTTAEAAVLDGIGACDISHRGLLIEAVRSMLRRRASSVDAAGPGQLLPLELSRLFMLKPLSRDCFVLRLLVGLSPEVCAGLLDISITESEEAVYAGLNELPFLFSHRGMNQPSES